jgi:predicted O-methyltransferase YrrM
MVDLAYWQALTADQARAAMLSAGNVERVVGVFGALTPDPVFTPLIVDRIRAGVLDLRLAMAWLADRIESDRYLEIGVRRGFSSATVAAVRPHVSIHAFDLWVRDYVGVANPGPRFVREELARVGFRGVVTFVDGDSHRTLPRFFGAKSYPLSDRLLGRAVVAPARDFDLVLVDGDHSIEGAYRDLSDVLGHIRVGGAIVFDDIAPDLSQFDEAGLRAIARELGPDPHGRRGLLGVWRAIQQEHREFRYFEFTDDSPGLAFGIRMT